LEIKDTLTHSRLFALFAGNFSRSKCESRTKEPRINKLPNFTTLEIRNPKHAHFPETGETNQKSESQIPKTPDELMVFGHSCFEFVSDFVLRTQTEKSGNLFTRGP